MAWLHVAVLASALAGQVPASSPDDGRKDASSPAATSPDKKADEKEKAEKEGKAGSKTAGQPGKDARAAAKTAGAPRAGAPKAAAGPRVMTRSEMQKPKSPFLQLPGSEAAPADRYGVGGSEDWSDIPAWRQASFFGVRAQGRFFVYVIDCSESMIAEDRFARATMEVRRSVLALQAPQQFEVIFYNEGPIPMPGGPQPRPADTQNKNQLMSWLRLVDPDGGTDPRSALRQALSLRPEAVFLLSDGEFPPGTAEAVAHFNPNRIPIHCVDLSGEGGSHLRRIARDSGGKYAARPGNLQGKR